MVYVSLSQSYVSTYDTSTSIMFFSNNHSLITIYSRYVTSFSNSLFSLISLLFFSKILLHFLSLYSLYHSLNTRSYSPHKKLFELHQNSQPVTTAEQHKLQLGETHIHTHTHAQPLTPTYANRTHTPTFNALPIRWPRICRREICIK